MFVSNVCRIIVETVSAVSYHFEVGTNDWAEQFWRVMWDRLQKDSHEDSHRWSCHITHVGPCHCRLPIECWVFLTVAVQDPWSDFRWLGQGWKPPYAHLTWIIVSGVSVFAACPSVKFRQSYCLSHRQPKCRSLCSSVVWLLLTIWIWKRWISGTDVDGFVCGHNVVWWWSWETRWSWKTRGRWWVRVWP